MKTIPSLLFCSLLLLTATAGRAESSALNRTPSGVLGQDFAEFSFGVQDIAHLSPNFYDLSLNGNAAILPHLDLGGGLAFGWIRGNVDGHANALTGTATTYTTWNNVKPFFGTVLGYEWASQPFTDSNFGFWGASTGLEIPAGFFAFTPRLTYLDDFRHSATSAQQLTYETEVNCWLTRDTALFASAGYTDAHHSRFDSWNWRLGLRLSY